jgi:cytochrome c-type biogenesis protein CcmH
MMRVRLAWVVVAAVMVIAGASVQAQSVGLEAHTLTHRLMSPYCPGLLLADCGSQGAADLRAEILRRLQAGERPDAVERDLIARFGPAIRTEPEFSGLGIIAWLGPLVLGLAGLGLVVFVVRRATHRVGTSDGCGLEDVERDAGINLRLQDELEALD